MSYWDRLKADYVETGNVRSLRKLQALGYGTLAVQATMIITATHLAHWVTR